MSDSAGDPIIYEENRIKVLAALKDGRIDYLDLADWTFQDKFFAFLPTQNLNIERVAINPFHFKGWDINDRQMPCFFPEFIKFHIVSLSIQ